MKEIEAKTENRYEYRKPQEKRKHMIAPDYSDVDSIVYWANEAAYTYGVSGIAIWSLGQEDVRLWDSMPDQI